MFDETGDPKKSNRKRLVLLLSILGFGISIRELFEFLYLRQSIHGAMAGIWCLVAAGWAYRFRHFGESQITNLDIKDPK